MTRSVVIGAGVVGLCTAYELHKRGRQVTVLDMGQPGAACSAGNAGWVVPSFSGPLPEPGLTLTSLKWMLKRDSPLYIDPMAAPRLAPWLFQFWRHCNARDFEAGLKATVDLGIRTMTLYDTLVKDGVKFEMGQQGILYAFLTRSGFDHAAEHVDAAERAGHAAPQRFAGANLMQVEPALTDQIVGGFLYQGERHVRPETLTSGLAAWLNQRGVELRTGVEVLGLGRNGDRGQVLQSSAGDVSGDEFVLAAGAWSGPLARRFGFKLSIEAGKGYSVTVSRPKVQLKRPVLLGEVKLGCTPFNGALRMAGTMELSGLNTRLDPKRIAAVRRAAERYLPGSLQGDAVEEWTGMRPVMPDGLPVVGRAPGLNNVYVATGHAMLGVTLGPSTGEALADLMVTGTSAVNLKAFDPGRSG